jgi:hypothetical protein
MTSALPAGSRRHSHNGTAPVRAEKCIGRIGGEW